MDAYNVDPSRNYCANGKEEQDKRDKTKDAYAKGNAALGKQLEDEADSLRRNYGSGSASRMVATALTGAAGSDVTGSLGGLVRGLAVNVIQSKLTSEVKYLVDGISDPAARESARGALQGLVGCAGATAGGSGSCGSAAMGAAASVVINNILNSLEKDKKERPRYDEQGKLINRADIEEQERRANTVSTIVGAIAALSGTDANAAVTAAIIETQNNQEAPAGVTAYGKLVSWQAFVKTPEYKTAMALYKSELVVQSVYAAAHELAALKKTDPAGYNAMISAMGGNAEKATVIIGLRKAVARNRFALGPLS